MNRVCIYIIFLIAGYQATAQVDTTNKITAKDTSIASQIRELPGNTPAVSQGYFLPFHTEALQIHKISVAPFRYNYLSNRIISGDILNIAGTIVLSFLGEKTRHTYDFRPGNLLRTYSPFDNSFLPFHK